MPGQHLVEHAAEREDIGATVDCGSASLLRRHISNGPNHAAWNGGGRSLGRTEVRCGIDEPRHAEVEDLDRIPARQEQVFRLDVAVHDTGEVRGAEAARGLDGDVERLAECNRTEREPMPQRRSVEQLRDEIGLTVLGARVEHRQNRRVVEG